VIRRTRSMMYRIVCFYIEYSLLLLSCISYSRPPMKMHLQRRAQALPTKNLVNPAVMFQDSVCLTPLYAFSTLDLYCNLGQYVGLGQYLGGTRLVYVALGGHGGCLRGLNSTLQVLKNRDCVLPLSVNFEFSTDLCAILRMYFLPTDTLQYWAKLS
jgi:hypothetical protein